MTQIIDRYLAAVASHFYGSKRRYVYNNLKAEILEHQSDYEKIEDLIISFGHPRSMAYNYGYKPFISRIYNKYYINMFEKLYFTFSFLYLFTSALFYLNELNCISFVKNLNTSAILPSYIIWILSNPVIVLLMIALITYIIFLLYDKKNPVSQDYDLKWTKEDLFRLPHPSHYPDHLIDINIIIFFSVFFLVFTVFFNTDFVIEAQNLTQRMIHILVKFFQPFMTITILVHLLDMTKKLYSKKYLKYSIFINLFTFSTLTMFTINSNFLHDYLLPIRFNNFYIIVNTFIIGALLLLYFISMYKIVKNLRYYKYLYKK